MLSKILITVLALVVFIYANAAGADFVTDGLVSHWSFDEVSGKTVGDAVGGHDGTLVGNVTKAQGKFGGALKFDGVDTRVEIPDPAIYNFCANFTWSAWIKTEVDGTIVAETDGTDAQGPKTFFIRNGTLFFDTGWVAAAGANKQVNDGQWHYVAVTVEFNGADTIQFYVDGEPDAQGSMNVNQFPQAEFPLWIGFDGRADPGEFPAFVGIIDEVSVYNRVLSADEVKQNFDSGRPAFAVSPVEKLAGTWGEVKASW